MEEAGVPAYVGVGDEDYLSSSEDDDVAVEEAVDKALNKKSCILSASNKTYDKDNDLPVALHNKSKKKTVNTNNSSGKSVRLPIESKKKNTNGETIITFPFVEEPNNEKDRTFISLLNLNRPFTADYGSKINSWQELYDTFCTQTTLSGEPVFETVPCTKSLKKRFKEYVNFASKHKNLLNRMSGCDNIKNTQLLKDVYDIAQLYHDEEEKAKRMKEEKLNKDRQNRAAANEHRELSLGRLISKRSSNSLIPSDMSEEESNSKSTYTNKKRKSKKEYSQFSEAMESREQRLQLKEENRKEKLKLKEKELDIRKMEAENRKQESDNTKSLVESTQAMVTALMKYLTDKK